MTYACKVQTCDGFRINSGKADNMWESEYMQSYKHSANIILRRGALSFVGDLRIIVIKVPDDAIEIVPVTEGRMTVVTN
jgi:hypothetical protein